MSRPRFARRGGGRRALTLAFAPRLIIQLSGGCQISSSTNRAAPQLEPLLTAIALLHIETIQQPLSCRSRSLGSFSSTGPALLLWGDRFGNPQRPRTAEDDRASLRTSHGGILVIVLKEESHSLHRENAVGLKTNCVNRVVRNQARSDGHACH